MSQCCSINQRPRRIGKPPGAVYVRVPDFWGGWWAGDSFLYSSPTKHISIVGSMQCGSWHSRKTINFAFRFCDSESPASTLFPELLPIFKNLKIRFGETLSCPSMQIGSFPIPVFENLPLRAPPPRRGGGGIRGRGKKREGWGGGEVGGRTG